MLIWLLVKAVPRCLTHPTRSWHLFSLCWPHQRIATILSDTFIECLVLSVAWSRRSVPSFAVSNVSCSLSFTFTLSICDAVISWRILIPGARRASFRMYSCLVYGSTAPCFIRRSRNQFSSAGRVIWSLFLVEPRPSDYDTIDAEINEERGKVGTSRHHSWHTSSWLHPVYVLADRERTFRPRIRKGSRMPCPSNSCP